MSSFYLSHIVVSHVLAKISIILRLEVRAVRAALVKKTLKACKNCDTDEGIPEAEQEHPHFF